MPIQVYVVELRWISDQFSRFYMWQNPEVPFRVQPSFSFHRMLGVLRLESPVIDRPCTRTLIHFSSLLLPPLISCCPVAQERPSTLALSAIFFHMFSKS